MQSLASPVTSPSLNPSDFQTSRKRQRSLSMQSNTSSSSVKRSASDITSHDSSVRSPRSEQMTILSISDNSHDPNARSTSIPKSMTLPNATILPAEKWSLVGRAKNKKMEPGETWYLVSREWWKRWKKACTGEIDKEGPVNEDSLGPVNNASLLDEYGNLRPSLIEQVDVEFVPNEAWSQLVTWYGEPAHAIPRKVIVRGELHQTSLELHPPHLRVFLLVDSRTTSADYEHATTITLSAKDTLHSLCSTAGATLWRDSKPRPPFRVWRIDTVDIEGSKVLVEDFRQAHPHLLEASKNKTLDDALVESGDMFVVEYQGIDGWILDEHPDLEPSKSAKDPPQPLFNSNDGFFNRMPTSSSSRYMTDSVTTSVTSPSNSFDSLWSSNTTQSSKIFGPPAVIPSTSGAGPVVSVNGRTSRSIDPGTLGLGNMGNTCFMNSALQCLAHQKELTEYFLTGIYQKELNPDNPLGMHGAIAEVFGALLHRIWDPDFPTTSYSPREFKQQLQRFAPQFSGYQQHDSQELVAFLLDGLHEDLNRVLKKPYVEKPDWEGGGDLELVQLAKKSWEGYMMRNDSVIVDLFQGQYQSTLVCPECEKVSITFDPFMYLTLPLPVEKKWTHAVHYVPWDINKPHFRVIVELSRDASFRDMRTLLGRWMGTEPEHLLTLEIFSNRFYKNLDDSVLCGEMAENDIIVCFELPCHAQQSRTYKKQPNDPFVLPMYLCDATPVRNTYMTMGRGSASLFGYPTVVVVDRDQATDLRAIYDAVVDRLRRWTTNARDLYTWEPGFTPEFDEVPIQINSIPPVDSVTEINENGDIVTVQEVSDLEESDITDERSMVLGKDIVSRINGSPVKVGTKPDLFNLRLQVNHKDFGTTHSVFSVLSRFESWENRLDDAETQSVLLREGDALYCEFDENMKAFYFGDDRSHWEHALWNSWETLVHPEYEEAKKAAAERKHKGLALQDCLEEFTKEERLGEDDLWYCPRCKKHQQATKKFDLWKAPDVLVVHLKRFSNSRTLRDKIDTFIDFPISGLDLGDMVGERKVAKRLMEAGVDIQQLNLSNADEPLIYDLFGVDEHIGGLGGGHYRAYAYNHVTGRWYHFDDSYVTSARATDAVNANAYLLFYERRSSTSLGWKTYQKILDSKLEFRDAPDSEAEEPMSIDTQLPTPPSETEVLHGFSNLQYPRDASWVPSSSISNQDSMIPSPPEEPPDFETSASMPKLSQVGHYNDALQIATQRFNFPDPSDRASPTSSNEVEPDLEFEEWDTSGDNFIDMNVTLNPTDSPDWGPLSRTPSASSLSDINPFCDVNTQKVGKGTDSQVDNNHDGD